MGERAWVRGEMDLLQNLHSLLMCTIFLRPDTAATIFFVACFCAATIQGRPICEGGIYSFGKPADIRDS